MIDCSVVGLSSAVIYTFRVQVGKHCHIRSANISPGHLLKRFSLLSVWCDRSALVDSEYFGRPGALEFYRLVGIPWFREGISLVFIRFQGLCSCCSK